jgi:glucose/arabinose dehydrogenase
MQLFSEARPLSDGFNVDRLNPASGLGLSGRELVFVDTSLDAYRTLASSAAANAEVILLDRAIDGVDQITQALAGRRNLDAIHIISHGSSGALQLGSGSLSGLNLDATALQSWGQALSQDADILLYGCNVASDAAGQQFVFQLSQLTGADIAASTDLTGSTAKGGNWILEMQTGTIDRGLALSQAVQNSYQGTLAGFNYANFASSPEVVTNGNASKAGNNLRLTPDANSQVGSAFYNRALQVDGSTSFNTQFQFQLSGGQGSGGADGFTFVLHNDSRGAGAIGAGGGSVGYAGIGRSLAIEFDTYDNGAGDPDANHISLLRNGTVSTAVKNATAGLDLNGGTAMNAWVDYNAATKQLSVFLSNTTTKPGTAVLTETIDLAATVGNQAFIGFTGATGGLRNLQEIQNWTFNSNASFVGTTTGGGPNGTGTGLRGEYFDNINFTNSVLTRTDSTINFNWGSGSPAPNIASDTFSVRWTGQIEARYGEEYTFYTTSDDGVRLKINGQTVVDRFIDQPSTTASGKITLAAGQKYNIEMEYYENGGGADAKLEWSSARQAREVVSSTQLYAPATGPSGNGTGLSATYYDNINFTNPVLTRTDAKVDFDWGQGSPAANIGNNTFSVVWTGQVEARYSETYTFFTNTDDGVKLFVNGQQVINRFIDQAPTTVNGTPIALQAGQKYDIRMEYFENGGGAVAQLGWQSASQAREIIPQSQLYSATGGSAGTFEIDVTGVTVSEGAGNAIVRVNRVNGSRGVATVDYVTNENTAKRDLDFTYRTQTLTFADGETFKDVAIPIIDDTLVESTEAFGVAILGATGASLGTKRTVSVDILDNDSGGGFEFSQSAYETKEDGGQATITVRRTGNVSGAASVNFATSNGTAIAGSDYSASTGTLSFAANEVSKTFTIAIANDTLGERNETVNLQLSNAVGGTLNSQSNAVLNILDNDPGSFTRDTVINNLVAPTAIEWTPNGQYLFIAQQNGEVKVANTSTNQVQATNFIDLRDQVNGVRDRGLLGMTLDPQFASGRPYVYLLFTYDPPEAGQTSRPGYSTEFGGQDKPGNRPARLIRVEAEFVNGGYRAKAGSEIVLLGKNSNFANTIGFDSNSTLVANKDLLASGYLTDPDPTDPTKRIYRLDANGNRIAVQDYIAGDSESHSVGSVQFGADGKLYVSTGDASSYNFADKRAMRVQDLNNLSGKMLRIDPDTGAGLADNPFATADLNSNRSKVYDLGLRNPFRFTFDPITNEPVIADVGWFSWEEINRSKPGGGTNFAWPGYEGGLDASGQPLSIRTPDYQTLPEVTPLYSGPSAITPEAPIFAFQHQAGGGDAIIMGEFYQGTTFPAFYDKALFYTNVSRGTVSTVFFDQTGKVTGTQLFADNLGGVVQLNVGPDGSLYYVRISDQNGVGSIGRWRPNSSTAPNAPIALPNVTLPGGSGNGKSTQGLFENSITALQ